MQYLKPYYLFIFLLCSQLTPASVWRWLTTKKTLMRAIAASMTSQAYSQLWLRSILRCRLKYSGAEAKRQASKSWRQRCRGSCQYCPRSMTTTIQASGSLLILPSRDDVTLPRPARCVEMLGRDRRLRAFASPSCQRDVIPTLLSRSGRYALSKYGEAIEARSSEGFLGGGNPNEHLDVIVSGRQPSAEDARCVEIFSASWLRSDNNLINSERLTASPGQIEENGRIIKKAN